MSTIRTHLQEQPFLKTYLKREKLFLQIPDGMLNKQMLFVRHNDGYKVVSKHIIWTKFQNYILLETIRVESLSGVKIPISNNAASTRSILAKFPIIIDKADPQTSLIEVSGLLLTDQIDWYRSSHETIINDLTFVKNVKNLSNEVLIQTIWGVVKEQSRITIPVDFSFFLLPEAMSSRKFDYRMGFRTENYEEGLGNNTRNSLASIIRWRLEKKYPDQVLSEPIKPIVFNLSPEIPEKWWPYLRKGILAWLPAFEEAGFKNAIVVKNPSKEHSGNIEFNSVNHSVVRWGNFRDVRGYESGGGASVNYVIDERSGEILKSDIVMGSTLQYLMDSYFIRCAASDTRAQQYPFSDELIGELLQSLVGHEAGHSFGLIDGHYGEYAYSVENIRNKEWLEQMGHTPSIMTYARHNNLAQPEDSIPSSLLIQKVGPTDSYSIRWAYTPFETKAIDRNESDFLERIIREQDTVPWYRRSISHAEIIGPGATNEVVESNDPVRGTELALKNLERTMALIPKINKFKNDYQLAERLYGKGLDLWQNQMRQVLSLIGGFDIRYKVPAQDGTMYTPIPLEEQYKALDYFLLHAFNPPKWLAYPEWKKGLDYSTYPDRLTELQINLLADLLSAMRMKRLEYTSENLQQQRLFGKVISQIQSVLFSELKEGNREIEGRRQELQKFYLERVLFGIEYKGLQSMGDAKRSVYSQKIKSIFRYELHELQKLIVEILETAENNKGHMLLLLKSLKQLE
tara:strand:- start:8219 stop:10441 length:2223 start_codon:yes stop_codon:yes gene_type:complete